MKLIGNANAKTSHLERESDVINALLPVVRILRRYHLSFLAEFANKGKELVDQVRAMRSTITRKVAFVFSSSKNVCAVKPACVSRQSQ